MVTRQIRSVDIQEREDFDDLLRELGEYAHSVLTIDIGTDVEALAIPGEFEELYATAQSSDVRIELVTDDPVRQELARIYGMRLVPDVTRASVASLGLEDRNGPPAPLPPQPAVQTHSVELAATEEFLIHGQHRAQPGTSDGSYSPFDTQASFSFVTASDTARIGAAGRPRFRRVERRDRRVSRSLNSGSIVISVVAIVAAVVVLLVSLLAPSAQITVVPETRALSAEVTYGLAGNAGALDVEVEPTFVSEALTFEATIPTSGASVVPETPARGMAYLSNPHTESYVLPAGTVFALPDGSMTYASLEAIEVPASDPFQSAQFGTAVVGIEAMEPGPTGNLDVGGLSGTLESGIMFQNRFPLEGGALTSVAVVAEEDLEELSALTRSEFESRIGSALNAQIPEGWLLIGSPEILEEMTMTFTAQVGAAATSVAVQAQTRVAGEIYDPVALETLAREQLLGRLSAAVPEGFGLVVESIRTSAQIKFDDSGNGALSMRAEGSAEAVLGAEFEDEFASKLVGKSENYASQALQEAPGIESFTVEYGPGWLPWSPTPRLSERITVDVDGS